MKSTKAIKINLITLCLTVAAFAQSTAFTYQGRLTDSNNAPTGTYQMEFKLFDASTGGTQIGATIENPNIPVTQGVFTVNLDFGANAFTGANRFLEIAVRRNSNENFTVLSPRQQIASSPYSIRTISAQQADVALNSNKLGGVDAAEYVTTSTAANSFIRNSAATQTANFNLSGNGTLGGILQASEIRAQTGTGLYGLTQTDGTTTVGTYVGGSTSGAAGGWFGTLSNSPLHFFTNNGQPQMTVLQNGFVGIGTSNPQAKFQLAGNAAQDRASGGFVKAMLNVAADGTIVRCYNGITGSSAGNCGFTVTVGSSGIYTINLGFQVTDRFLSVAARGINGQIGVPPTPISADYRFSSFPNANPNEVTVDTFRPDTGATANNPFMLIIY